jgi:hypothetical protein
MALKQSQEEMVEQGRVAQKKNDELQTKLEEERPQVKQENEQLLVEQLRVKEVVDRALHSMMGLEPKEEDRVEHQAVQLEEAIQQLQ